MYRSGVTIETFEGDRVKLNIEGVGRKCRNGYLVHFDCSRCKNQSIADDENVFESCNNYAPVVDKTDKHMYCLNYEEER